MTSRSLRGYAAFAEMPLPAERLWPWLVDPVPIANLSNI